MTGSIIARADNLQELQKRPRLFSTWGARMLALIGRLPATLEDRAIVLPMRRRAPGEAVDRVRRPPGHRVHSARRSSEARR